MVPQPTVTLRALLPVQVFQFAYDRTPENTELLRGIEQNG